MGNNFQGIESALVGLAVLGFFIVRQFTTRKVLSLWTVAAPIALAYFGFNGLASLDTTGWWLLALGMSLGVALGFVRGATFRVWTAADRAALMRGTGLTLALWVVTIAVRVVMSLIEVQLGLGSFASNTAESLLPAAATIAAQTVVVYLRARDLPRPAIALS